MVPLALNNRGTGSKLVTRSGVFEIPVTEWLEHSFSVGFTYAFITSPLQVLYTRRSGNAYHRVLQTSWRGWADSKAVHSMECIGRARSTGGLSLSRGCCLQCAVLLVLGGVLPNLELELSHKEPKQQTPRSCAWVVYIAGDTLRHQPMGAGHMTVLQFCGPITFCVLQWCHPMLTRT